MASYEELKAEYVRLAKRADQRLVRIEKRQAENPELMRMAYKRAAHDIKMSTGEAGEKPRFNRNIAKTEKGLKRQIENVERFLNAKTSTWRGYKKEDLDKRTKSINEKFGTDFSSEDFTSVMQSKMIDKFGFYTAMDSIAVIQRNGEKLKELVDKSRRQHKKLSDYADFREIYKNENAVVQKAADKIVREFMREIGR